jgi:hypothetical protein
VTKPWEEEWIHDHVYVRVPAAGDAPERSYLFADATSEIDSASARLAAAAPEMARLLLEKQWGDRGWCLWCDGIDPADTTCRGEGHAADCALVAVLRKAGVRG